MVQGGEPIPGQGGGPPPPDRSPKPPLPNNVVEDITEEHLSRAGFSKRVSKDLSPLFTSNDVRDTVSKILAGEPVSVDSKEHRKQTAFVLGHMDVNTANLMTGNLEPLMIGMGSGLRPALAHIILGGWTELAEDIQVEYLLNSIRFVVSASGNRKVDQADIDSINACRPRLNEFATRVIGNGNWQEIAAVAKEYTQSQLAKEIHEKAEALYGQGFRDVTSYTGSVLTDYDILQNPQGFIQAARATYQDAYGLDSDIAHPVDVNSVEGRLLLREQYEERRRKAEALAKPAAGNQDAALGGQVDNQPPAALTGEGAQQHPQKDLSRWLLDNGRLNVVDGLTVETLNNLAKELGIRIDSDVQTEGELRYAIACGMINRWRQKGGEATDDEELEPFFLICGRSGVGFSGVQPEGLLSMHLMNFSSDDRGREKYSVIGELYRRYWEFYEKPVH